MFFGYTDKKYQEIKDVRIEIEEYEKALKLSMDILNRREDLQKKYNNFKPADLKDLESLLPDSIDNVKLILDMNTIARRYSMSLKGVKINDEKNEKGASSVAPVKTGLGSISVSFKVTSSYETFIKFLQDLEKSLRVVDVTSLAFKAADLGTYDFSVTIKTYWLNK